MLCSVGWSVTQQLRCLSCHTWYGSASICPTMQAGRTHLWGWGTPYSRVFYPRSRNDRDSDCWQWVSTVLKHAVNYLGGEGWWWVWQQVFFFMFLLFLNFWTLQSLSREEKRFPLIEFPSKTATELRSQLGSALIRQQKRNKIIE